MELERAEAERAAAAEQLYRSKASTTTYGGAGVDEQAEELRALRELFPDYSDDFADLERAKVRVRVRVRVS